MVGRDKQPKTHELATWAGRSWAITEPEFRYMRERMEAGAKFLTIPDGTDSAVAVSDIKFFGRRQITMSDMYDETKALAPGKPKEFDPLSKGYIKFLAMSIKLRRKSNGSLTQILEKITDDQRPLINAELEAAGVEYRV